MLLASLQKETIKEKTKKFTIPGGSKNGGTQTSGCEKTDG